MPMWLGILAMVVLAAVGFVGGYMTSQARESESIGLAPASMIERIDASISAGNSGNTAAFAASFTDDAVFTNLIWGQQSETVGADKIAAEYGTGTLQRTSEVIQKGDFYAFSYEHTRSNGLMVEQLTSDGHIAHIWLIG